jgi:Uma2 family endonuclease
MATALPIADIPPSLPQRRWSLREYHRMIELGFLTEDDRFELLEGWLIEKMPHNPPHDGTVYLLQMLLAKIAPPGWIVRTQSALTLRSRRGSEPEPDLAVVRGPAEQYLDRHPGPADTGLVAEVSATTLVQDRGIKQRAYARAGIPFYWIVNIPSRVIEVYDTPLGGRNPAYQRQTDAAVGTSISLTLDGRPVGKIPIARVFPRS